MDEPGAELRQQPQRQSFCSSMLRPFGISTSSYPFGPNWTTVMPYQPNNFCAPKNTLPSDLGTTRRLQFPRPPSALDAGSLRYPETYVPYPTQSVRKHINFNVKFKGAGLDGLTVPVTVRSTCTVAEIITTAVENLRHSRGANVPYSNLRVTGLYSEAGRPLSAGYRLHSQGQVPQVREGATMVLKVLV